MASAWGLSWGRAWGNAWGALGEIEPPQQPAGGYGGAKRRREHWPSYQELVESRQAAETAFSSAKIKHQARKAAIRAATAVRTSDEPAAVLDREHALWAGLQPVISYADGYKPDTRLAFMAAVGEILKRWQDEEDAILVLML